MIFFPYLGIFNLRSEHSLDTQLQTSFHTEVDAINSASITTNQSIKDQCHSAYYSSLIKHCKMIRGKLIAFPTVADFNAPFILKKCHCLHRLADGKAPQTTSIPSSGSCQNLKTVPHLHISLADPSG